MEVAGLGDVADLEVICLNRVQASRKVEAVAALDGPKPSAPTVSRQPGTGVHPKQTGGKSEVFRHQQESVR